MPDDKKQKLRHMAAKNAGGNISTSYQLTCAANKQGFPAKDEIFSSFACPATCSNEV
jgi:hypothetical protein